MQCIMFLPLSSPPNMDSRRLKAASKEVTACFFWRKWWLLWRLRTVLRRPTFSSINPCSFTTSPSAPRSACNFCVSCTAILASACLSWDWHQNKTQSFNTSSWNMVQIDCEVVTGKRTVQFSALFSTAARSTSSWEGHACCQFKVYYKQKELIIIIFIYCNWVVTRWQWLFYM